MSSCEGQGTSLTKQAAGPPLELLPPNCGLALPSRHLGSVGAGGSRPASESCSKPRAPKRGSETKGLQQQA